MDKIIPHLWFDTQAEEAVSFYVLIFKNSGIGHVARYGQAGADVSGRPAGTVMTVSFTLAGQEFLALNGGPIFTFSPAVSFFVNCDTIEEIDALWEKLSAGGKVRMALDRYPFSEKYGWVEDRYGVSWQLMLGTRPRKISPALMFVGKQLGKAEEAMGFYSSVFAHSGVDMIARYEKGEGGPEGAVKHAKFLLFGQEFVAFDSHVQNDFAFTPAISFLVNCATQEEVDELWRKLSTEGEEGQCGWLTDRYGLSWQIVPTALGEMMADRDTERSERVMKALLTMRKIDIGVLRQAYQG